MSDPHRLNRRDFLKRSTAMLAAGLSGRFPAGAGQTGIESVQEAARIVGRLPRRKLGYSGREVSIIIGAGDLAAAPTEAAIQCGINYWHKANLWVRTGVPAAILKDREAHYVQVTVDRIGGNHEVGRIDEQSHYDFVKETLERTGLGYFDDMQLHYGYHNVAEVKNERGFVRAFERLKKEGLVKHICLSQHSYAGNPRVPGGESAAEILTAVIEDGIYEFAQLMYSYGYDPETNEFLRLAQSRGFGTIAMKTARGMGRMKQDSEFMAELPAGSVPHNALARWLTTATDLTGAVIRVRNLNEFAETYSGAGKSLRAEDARAIEMMTLRADSTACRLCTKCQLYCPEHIPIAEILRFERYALDDGDLKKAGDLYAGLERKGNVCSGCGDCLAHCPQKLAIPGKLASTHSLLSRE